MAQILFHATNILGFLGLALIWFGIYEFSRISRDYENHLQKVTDWAFLDIALPFIAATPVIILIAIYAQFTVTGVFETLLFGVLYALGGFFVHMGAHDLKEATKLKEPKNYREIAWIYSIIFILISLFFILLAHGFIGKIITVLLTIAELELLFSFVVLAALLKERRNKYYMMPFLAGLILPLDALLGAFGHAFLAEAALEGSLSAIDQLNILRFVGMLIYLVTGLLLVIASSDYFKR